MLGEFGGLGLRTPGHEYSPSGGFFAYEWQPNSTALTDRYVGLVQGVRNLMIGKGLSASIYTEITDLEGELNGFLTYDRQVVKMDQARVRAANQALINASRALPSTAAVALPVERPALVAGHHARLHQPVPAALRTASPTPRWSRRASPALLKNDATYTIRAGLAERVAATRSSRSTSRASSCGTPTRGCRTR